jgi:hypothetical protein
VGVDPDRSRALVRAVQARGAAVRDLEQRVAELERQLGEVMRHLIQTRAALIQLLNDRPGKPGEQL